MIGVTDTLNATFSIVTQRILGSTPHAEPQKMCTPISHVSSKTQ